MTHTLNDLDFIRAAQIAENIAAYGHAGFALERSDIDAKFQRSDILKGLHKLAALHGLKLIERTPDGL